jgi:uridylate kinase
VSLPYRRILLKLSGEALAGKQGFGFDPTTLDSMSKAVSEARESGVQTGIVVGGGNIFRGQDSSIVSDRVSADQMGMLATCMNSLAIKGSLEKAGVRCVVLGAVAIPTVVEGFDASRARDLLDQGCVVVFAGGTGNPTSPRTPLRR